MIQTNNITLSGRIKGINLSLPKTGLIGIIGPNGAGKSSLLKCLAGIETPCKGDIHIDNHPLSQMDLLTRGKLIGYLAQNTPVAWDMPVYEVLSLGLIEKCSDKHRDQKIKAIATAFSLDAHLHRSVFHLSGGELARVHLARALIKASPILLADEPIAALDPYYQIDMMQHLHNLSTKQLCVIVLHDLSLAYRFCEEIILLDKGELLAYDKTAKVIINENLRTVFKISATIDSETSSLYNIDKQY